MRDRCFFDRIYRIERIFFGGGNSSHRDHRDTERVGRYLPHTEGGPTGRARRLVAPKPRMFLPPMTLKDAEWTAFATGSFGVLRMETPSLQNSPKRKQRRRRDETSRPTDLTTQSPLRASALKIPNPHNPLIL